MEGVPRIYGATLQEQQAVCIVLTLVRQPTGPSR